MSEKKLVVVESPAKARTLAKFLGRGYTVRASIGHIRDLPERQLGVDLQNGFQPRYVIPPKKQAVVKELREEVKQAAVLYLATDPDREGEAISWHLAEVLKPKGKPVHRVEFHEITERAVAEAFAHPRPVNMPLVEAQQARRILDRLVGYSLSPLLRRKVAKRNLSAGRVQSVALRLVVEREREIRAFQPQEYWTIEAELSKREGPPKQRRPFTATLHQVWGQKAELRTEAEAKALVADLEGAVYRVLDLRQREVQRQPAPPFITSTLQQEASRKLGFTPARTMRIAQQLYEGLAVGDEGSVGLITYMRTDSTNLADSAVAELRGYIGQRYGAEYLPAAARVFKAKAKGAQEAHEAIRPTAIRREPGALKPYLSPEQHRLYTLIWQRTLACQMAAARLEATSVDIAAGRGDGEAPYLFRATGSVVRFAGFMAVYTEGRDEGEPEEEKEKALPPLAKGELLDLLRLVSEQHFTQPPLRYTEASLVKALEEYGIGRPSTYAPTLATIQARGYVQRAQKQLVPTELGFLVNDLLVEQFPHLINVDFTAQMEEQLDDIARGEHEWVGVVRDFFGPFEEDLRRADQEMRSAELKPEPAGVDCEVCGKPMVIKWGRYGKFIACTGFPACRQSKPLLVPVGGKCPECGADLVERTTRRRKRTFYGCARYPRCRFATWQRPLPQPCGACGGLMVLANKQQGKCVKCGHLEEASGEAQAGARGSTAL